MKIDALVHSQITRTAGNQLRSQTAGIDTKPGGDGFPTLLGSQNYPQRHLFAAQGNNGSGSGRELPALPAASEEMPAEAAAQSPAGGVWYGPFLFHEEPNGKLISAEGLSSKGRSFLRGAMNEMGELFARKGKLQRLDINRGEQDGTTRLSTAVTSKHEDLFVKPGGITTDETANAARLTQTSVPKTMGPLARAEASYSDFRPNDLARALLNATVGLSIQTDVVSQKANTGSPIPPASLVSNATAGNPLAQMSIFTEAAQDAAFFMDRMNVHVRDFLPTMTAEIARSANLSSAVEVNVTRENTGRMELQLLPKAYGLVNVKFEMKGDQLRIEITVQKEIVQSIIRSELANLKEMMGGSGFNLEEVSYKFDPDLRPQAPARDAYQIGSADGLALEHGAQRQREELNDQPRMPDDNRVKGNAPVEADKSGDPAGHVAHRKGRDGVYI